MAKATTPKKKNQQAVNTNTLKDVTKVLAIYICWLFIYEFWLLPNESLVDTTAGILSGFNYDIYTAGRLIGLGEAPEILLKHGSTGISTIGLLVGFIIVYTGRRMPRLSFLIIGLGVIYIVNIIIVIVLTITQAY